MARVYARRAVRSNAAERKQAPRKQFFFEKKNQKTFAHLDECRRCGRGKQYEKSFLVLFFKKELLPFYGGFGE